MKSERKNNVHKSRIVQKHKRLGVDLGYSIAGLYSDEAEALDAEVDLIARIGRHDLQEGPLTNRSDGGDGSTGHLALRGGKSASARPVIAAGSRYTCLADAASHFKVTSGAISHRIKNGWSGYFYEDEGQQRPRPGILSRYKRPVFLLGETFESLSQASRDTGVPFGLIAKRIRYGWEGYFYVDRGQLPRRTNWKNRKDKVAVEIHGVNYATTADASRSTGESVAKIYSRARSSNYPRYRRKDGLVVKKNAPPANPTPVIAEGKHFLSVNAAANEFGLSSGGVLFRCRSSNYLAWCFVDSERQQAEMVDSKFSSAPIQVVVNGLGFESQSAAARHHGIDINTLKKRCRSLSFPNWLCKGIGKEETKDGRLGLVAIRINHVDYRSVSEASRILGLSRPTIKARVESGEWTNYVLANTP